MRVATSFISLEQAQRNLTYEIGERSFDTLLEEGQETWNTLLGRAVIEGADDAQLRTLLQLLIPFATLSAQVLRPRR